MGSVDASDPAGDAVADTARRASGAPQLAVAGGVKRGRALRQRHPFDALKTQMQVAGAVGGGDVVGAEAAPRRPAPRPRPRGTAARSRTARALVRREGPLGFYRGFGAVAPAIPFASAAYFGGYEAAKRAVDAFRDAAETRFPLFKIRRAGTRTESPTFSYVASGVIAQSFASVAYTPIDVVPDSAHAGERRAGRAPGARALRRASSPRTERF